MIKRDHVEKSLHSISWTDETRPRTFLLDFDLKFWITMACDVDEATWLWNYSSWIMLSAGHNSLTVSVDRLQSTWSICRRGLSITTSSRVADYKSYRAHISWLLTSPIFAIIRFARVNCEGIRCTLVIFVKCIIFHSIFLSGIIYLAW